MFLCFFCFFFLFDFLYSIYCGYSFELHQQADAIQMSTHNICLYEEVDKKYTGCNKKTMELLDCALIGVCVVIRLNRVYAVACLSQFLVSLLLIQEGQLSDSGKSTDKY